MAMLAGRPASRVPVLPRLEALAGRVADTTYRQLAADPTALVAAMQRAATLVGAEQMLLGWDETILAEACGVDVHWDDDRPRLAPPPGSLVRQPEGSGRLDGLRQSLVRVRAANAGAPAMALAGPGRLARQVFGGSVGRAEYEQLKPVLVDAMKAFCAEAPALVILLENGTPLPDGDLRRLYATLNNVAQYYGVPLAVAVDTGAPAPVVAHAWSALRIEHLILTPGEGELPPDAAALRGALEHLSSLAIGVDPSQPEGAADYAESIGPETRRGRLWFVTAAPIARDADVTAVRRLLERVGTIH